MSVCGLLCDALTCPATSLPLLDASFDTYQLHVILKPFWECKQCSLKTELHAKHMNSKQKTNESTICGTGYLTDKL